MTTKLTAAQRKVLEALSAGQNRRGSGQSLPKLVALGLVEYVKVSEWMSEPRITEEGRKAL